MRAADSGEQSTEHYGMGYVDPQYSDLVAVVGREVWGAGSLGSTQQNNVWPGPPGLQDGKDETSLSPQLWTPGLNHHLCSLLVPHLDLE